MGVKFRPADGVSYVRTHIRIVNFLSCPIRELQSVPLGINVPPFVSYPKDRY